MLTSRLGIRQFNYRLIARVTGILLLYMAASMALPLTVSLYWHDGAQFAIVFSALLILLVGLLLRNIVGRHAQYDIKENESYWVTVVVWVVVPLCGTLPYILTSGIADFVDALFESFSGYTTTGSSVLPHPEDMPPSLLVYRSFTQWIGGLGLMLFVLAILRRLTFGATQLYEAEFSGTQQRKLHPRLSKSVSRLWTIYTLLTVAMFVALFATGTRPVDALCLAFSTVSTGGFVTHSDGLWIMGDAGITVATVFMLLSGVNVALLYRFFTLKWKHLWRDEELGVYTLVFVLAVAVCTVSFMTVGNDWEQSIRYSLFHLASTMSSCGFYIPRPERWSFLVSVITFLLIIIGASAGSTGGGIKWRRIITLMKYIGNYLTRMLHPQAVFKVKVNGEVVETDYINKTLAFVFLYTAFIVGGAFMLTLCGSTIPDAVCMAAANISNLGPSPLINNLGGSLDYAALPSLAKCTLVFLMLAGRLELFALIAIFSPSYWKRG